MIIPMTDIKAHVAYWQTKPYLGCFCPVVSPIFKIGFLSAKMTFSNLQSLLPALAKDSYRCLMSLYKGPYAS